MSARDDGEVGVVVDIGSFREETKYRLQCQLNRDAYVRFHRSGNPDTKYYACANIHRQNGGLVPELKLPLSAECKLESGHDEAMRGERISGESQEASDRR